MKTEVTQTVDSPRSGAEPSWNSETPKEWQDRTDELTRLREENKNLRTSCDILKGIADAAKARVAELENQ